MREVNVSIITDNIKEMCIEANHFLTDDMKNVFENAVKNEESALGKQVLGQLEENLKVAGEDMIPICQDTGMAVVFINVGQDVHLTGGDITDAINEGVRRGYVEGYLRKSVVKDPIYRENTKDNTPAVIHFNIVPGDKVDITVAPKGFGSENMSRVFMLKPADGIEGVKEAILTAVKDAGPNACPPMVVGVGIGGTFEKCALMAKEALTREVGTHSDIPYVKELEEELLKKINKEKDITILISSHILGELSEMATTYGIISNGKLIEEISSSELSQKCRQYIDLKVDDAKKAVIILERQFGITDYEVLENNKIKIFSHLNETGAINMQLSKGGVVVEKIDIKGEKLEEYFMDRVGGEVSV